MTINIIIDTYNYFFSIGQTLFILSAWTIANIFLLTATTLGVALEVQKLTNQKISEAGNLKIDKS